MMRKRFFSLLILPDSGSAVRTGKFHSNAIIAAFGVLLASFIVCLVIVIGYHIKVSQEISYKNAQKRLSANLETIEESRENLSSLHKRLKTIQYDDEAYRLYALMNVRPDEEMYNAGVGGHELIPTNLIKNVPGKFKKDVQALYVGIAAMSSRVGIQRESLEEIEVSLQKYKERLDNTPSIRPTPNPHFITSGYGSRIHPKFGYPHFHPAVDMAGRLGDPIIASANGVVLDTGWMSGYGKCVKIQHKYGFLTVYAHMSTILVKKGDVIKRGDRIGKMGRTGTATGTHLHYEVRLNNKPVNPRRFFD
jgi:murein DD-endopeptidase MepM/ murein hydrolase activator NlpD